MGHERARDATAAISYDTRDTARSRPRGEMQIQLYARDMG